jgi:hypothetical protein
MIKTTCSDCNKKQKHFCRRYNVAKNSPVCELVQNNNYYAAKKKIC